MIQKEANFSPKVYKKKKFVVPDEALITSQEAFATKEALVGSEKGINGHGKGDF